jgi:uncharacterized membrane protein YkoI
MVLVPLGFGALADDPVLGRYALPRDKRTVYACEQAALMSHPGRVREVKPRNTAEQLRYRIEIEDRSEQVWVVVCEAATQKILTDQLLP